MRFGLTYLILAVGIQVVYSSMSYSHANHPANVVWRLVSTLHFVIIWGGIGFGLVTGLLILANEVSFAVRAPDGPTPKPIDHETLAEERRQYEERKRLEAEEYERQKQLKHQAEIQRKKLIGEERRLRSAEKAVRSALDEF